MTLTGLTEAEALVSLLRELPKGARWSDVSEQLLASGSALRTWDASHAPEPGEQDALIPEPRGGSDELEQVRADVATWADKWNFVSVLDEDYPEQLRGIHQAPPFLFAAGDLRRADRAIAVVGSRKASDVGITFAEQLAEALVDLGVTVLSGLAEGIDGAAHRTALRLGGRTVAVIGTGISNCYPAAHRELQSRIAEEGLVLSQFWPDAPPQPQNFIMRNATMSGYGMATVVVEAGENSGARAQARMAVEHGRPVILTASVVAMTEWGRTLAMRPGVEVVDDVESAVSAVQAVLTRDADVDQLLRKLAGFEP